jgi:LAO/AO transport system kinase
MNQISTAEGLATGILASDRRALSRAMSWVEDEHPGVEELFRKIHPRTGRALRVGITGPPGAGKSTLVARMTALLRGRGMSVGIVAVDPTSPFTGGALLGDRVRMPELSSDPGVFMRSMATRGSLGGIAASTHEVMDLLDAFGVSWILVETVGVGQSELDVARMTDVTVVVLVPESGDAVQAMKAGLMEIGDIFVVNKADRDGAERAIMEIRSMIDLRDRRGGREIEVLPTTAVEGRGVAELLERIESLAAEARVSGSFSTRRHSVERFRLIQLAQRKLVRSLTIGREGETTLERLAAQVMEGRLTPHEAASELVQAATREAGSRRQIANQDTGNEP